MIYSEAEECDGACEPGVCVCGMEDDGPMAEPGDDYKVSRDEDRYYGDWED